MQTTVTSLEQKHNKVFVTFSNGKKEIFDLVVGADGIHSPTRNFLGKEIEKDTGVTGFICITRNVKTSKRDVTEIWDKNKFFGSFPLSKDRLCAFFAVATKDIDARINTLEILQKSFSSFGWIVPNILSSLKDSEDIHKTQWWEVLPSVWYKKRVVLLGDAAHGMIPALGMGASMALEDALLLAQELAKGNIDQALKVYYKKRKVRVEEIRRYVNFVGSFRHIQSASSVAVRSFALRRTPNWFIEKKLKKILSSPY